VRAQGMGMSQSDTIHNTMIDLNDLTIDLKAAILEESDPATQDVLVEIQRGIDKWLWMFTASS